MPRFKLNWLQGPDKIKSEEWLRSVFDNEKSVQVAQNPTLEDESEFNNQKKRFFLPSSFKKKLYYK